MRYDITINYVRGWAEPDKILPGTAHMQPDVVNGGGFIIGWSATGIGFGELTVHDDGNHTFTCDTEAMGQGFLEAVLLTLAKTWVRTNT